MPMPTITVVGGVYEDPELRFSQSGKPVVAVKCVVKDRKKDSTGQWVDGEPWFLRVTAFGDLAEHVAESVQRGDTVLVSGRMEMNRWEKDGEKRETLQMVADEVALSLRWSTYTRDGSDVQSQRPSRPAAQDDQPPF